MMKAIILDVRGWAAKKLAMLLRKNMRRKLSASNKKIAVSQ
jgi:hypothetical protein